MSKATALHMVRNMLFSENHYDIDKVREVINVMNAFPTVLHINLHGCLLLAYNRHSAIEAGGVQTVLSVMSSFPESVAILQYDCFALHKFSDSFDVSALLSTNGVVNLLRRASCVLAQYHESHGQNYAADILRNNGYSL